MTVPDIAPRKPPRQRRAAATVGFMLEAATRILETEGLGALTTNRVAEVAGVSVGSLYQYFPNKAALVAALIEQAQTAIAAEVEQLAAANATLDEALDVFADFAVRQQFDRPLLAATLDAEERRLPVQPMLDEAERRVRAAIEMLAARHGHRDPAAAAHDLFVIGKALVESYIDTPGGPPPDLPRRLRGMLAGYFAGG